MRPIPSLQPPAAAGFARFRRRVDANVRLPMLRGAVGLVVLLACVAGSGGAQQDKSARSPRAAAAQAVIAIRALSQDTTAIANARAHPNASQSVVTDPSGREWLAQGAPILATQHIAGASLVSTQPDQARFPGEALQLTLTPEGRSSVLTASRQLIGQGMGVFVDGKLVVAAIVRSELQTHSLEFTMPSLSTEQLQDLVRRINAR